MEKIYKDGEVLEASDLNASFSELEEQIKNLVLPKWQPLTLGSKWEIVAGYEPKICKIGALVCITGLARRGSGASIENLATLPEGCRPSSTQFVGTGTASNGGSFEMYITNAGILKCANYESVGGNANIVYPLSCTFALI